MRELIAKAFDLREGETRPALEAFVTLFGLIAAHTMLETARDALFLSKLPPERLTLVYALVAFVTFVVSDLNARFVRQFGKRNALIFTLLIASYGTVYLHFKAPTPTILFVLYAWSALVGTLIGVQFWMFAGEIFTVAQGKRLFGPIASGGVAGAVVGASFAAIALTIVPVASLLLVSAGIFLVTALFLTTVKPDEVAPAPIVPKGQKPPEVEGILSLFRRQPYLRQLAAFVGLSTAGVLVTDFLFKSIAAESIARADLGTFFARTYAALNALSLFVQLFVAGRVLRRLGVVPALIILPFLILAGSAGIFVFGAVLALALFTKGADGALRYSLQRVASELLWMPLSGDTRDRGKALLDSVFGRVVQAAMAGLLLLMSMAKVGSPRILAALAAVIAVAWLYTVAVLRRSYLDLFRQALSRGTLEGGLTAELDLTAIETVMESLSSRDQTRVLASMELLHDKGRTRIIPGLILYHESEDVLLRALEIIATRDREDWPPLAERLLTHKAETVRVASLRALARLGNNVAVVRALQDDSPLVRGQAAFWAARDNERNPAENYTIRELLALEGQDGIAARIALCDAIRDTPDQRFADLLVKIVSTSEDGSVIDHGAKAMTKLKDGRFISVLIDRLTSRNGRHVAREALVNQGEEALEVLIAKLEDPATDSRLRLHLPRTISRFASQRAADVLIKQLLGSEPGNIRYKALRGLGRIVADVRVKVDSEAMEGEVKRNLVEHMRVLSLMSALDQQDGGEAAATRELVLGLLDDKRQQAIERAFRGLQIIHPNEDIRSTYQALATGDKRLRAQAMEFLDTLTLPRRRPSQTLRDLRTLLRIVADDLPPRERVRRASELLPPIPSTAEDALVLMLNDTDDALATLAGYHALSLGSARLVEEVAKVCAARPALMIATIIDMSARSQKPVRRAASEGDTHAGA